MPASDQSPSDTDVPARNSRLAASLLKLQQQIATTGQDTQLRESLFRQWQEQWQDRGERIARQLSIINSQLSMLTDDAATMPDIRPATLSLYNVIEA